VYIYIYIYIYMGRWDKEVTNLDYVAAAERETASNA
jgi:hypothetical protein